MFSRIRTVKEAYNNFESLLKKNYSDEEARSIASMVFDDILGYDRIKLIMNENDLLSASLFEQLDMVLNLLLNHHPIQYILGYSSFYGLKFKVNENVLIPRPETEELVNWILEDFSNDQSINIIDIGTGSGCIPIALKSKRNDWDILAIDISENALKLAQENAKKLNQDVKFQLADIFNYESDEKYQIVVSNPPYVLELEKTQMNKNVLEHEPSLALFVANEDPLIYYKRIIEFAKQNLAKNGCLYFEINETKGEEMIQLLELAHFVDIQLRKDMFGKDRMIKAKIN